MPPAGPAAAARIAKAQRTHLRRRAGVHQAGEQAYQGLAVGLPLGKCTLHVRAAAGGESRGGEGWWGIAGTQVGRQVGIWCSGKPDTHVRWHMIAKRFQNLQVGGWVALPPATPAAVAVMRTA